MIGFFLTTLVTALSLLIVDILFRGVYIANFPAAAIAALVIGLINGTVRPVLSLLSLPINFLSLGLFSFVVNGICFWLVGALVPGFAVHGLAAIILGPVILSLGTTFLNQYFAGRELPMLGSSAEIEKY
jgi:putative membrane protein